MSPDYTFRIKARDDQTRMYLLIALLILLTSGACSALWATQLRGSDAAIETLTLIAPFGIASPQFSSDISLVNKGRTPALIVAEFDSLVGERVGSKVVLLEPRASTTIDLDSLYSAGHPFGTLGPIKIFVNSARPVAIEGIARIFSRSDGKLRMEERLQPLREKNGSPLKAFIPQSFSVPVLVVHNLADLPQGVVVSCHDGLGETFESEFLLPAHMTFLVNACIRQRNEARSYGQLLTGDSGAAKPAANVEVSTQNKGKIAIWGFVNQLLSRPEIGQMRPVEFD